MHFVRFWMRNERKRQGGKHSRKSYLYTYLTKVFILKCYTRKKNHEKLSKNGKTLKNLAMKKNKMWFVRYLLDVMLLIRQHWQYRYRHHFQSAVWCLLCHLTSMQPKRRNRLRTLLFVWPDPWAHSMHDLCRSLPIALAVRHVLTAPNYCVHQMTSFTVCTCVCVFVWSLLVISFTKLSYVSQLARKKKSTRNYGGRIVNDGQRNCQIAQNPYMHTRWEEPLDVFLV